MRSYRQLYLFLAKARRSYKNIWLFAILINLTGRHAWVNMNTRKKALTKVLDELAEFEIPLNPYYDDAEPQGVIDDILSGKINSLRAFCQLLGWAELVAHMKDMTPLRGDAVEALDLIQAFVVPEARRLIEASNIDAPASPTQWFWEFLHPRICALAKPRFEAGFFWRRGGGFI
ncbi:MAG: hypothetical protein AB7E55_18210 [Pigmentiphaga sp.]